MPSNDDLLSRINLVRRDIGNLVFHFTKKTDSNETASTVLRKILTEGKLIGSRKNIRGQYPCICFTESPITELVSTFKLVNIASAKSQHTRYEPWGIAVTKEWLYSKGGRPAIYQSESEYSLLPNGYQYRHVRYEPGKEIDYMWEREWRINENELILPDETLVIVPTASEAFDIMFDTAITEANSYDDDGNVDSIYYRPRWLVVSLDFFGFIGNEAV